VAAAVAAAGGCPDAGGNAGEGRDAPPHSGTGVLPYTINPPGDFKGTP